MDARCPFPRKQKLTKARALAQVAGMNRHRKLPGGLHAYRCPAGGHWHVGHPRPPARKRRQW